MAALKRPGVIINLGSASGLYPMYVDPIYSGSKGLSFNNQLCISTKLILTYYSLLNCVFTSQAVLLCLLEHFVYTNVKESESMCFALR